MILLPEYSRLFYFLNISGCSLLLPASCHLGSSGPALSGRVWSKHSLPADLPFPGPPLSSPSSMGLKSPLWRLLYRRQCPFLRT